MNKHNTSITLLPSIPNGKGLKGLRAIEVMVALDAMNTTLGFEYGEGTTLMVLRTFYIRNDSHFVEASKQVPGESNYVFITV